MLACLVLTAVRQGDHSDDEDESIIGALQGRTFAPRDVSIAEFAPKDNVHGIGYQPLSARVRCAS